MNREPLDQGPPWPTGPRMNAALPTDSTSVAAEARRRVGTYCQSLVDIGQAQWRVNDEGDTELHMTSGEAYLFGELGLTRLR